LTKPERERFLTVAWSASREGVEVSVANLITDFPNHPLVSVATVCPGQEEHAYGWAEAWYNVAKKMDRPGVAEHVYARRTELIACIEAFPNSEGIASRLPVVLLFVLEWLDRDKEHVEFDKLVRTLRGATARFPENETIQFLWSGAIGIALMSNLTR